MEMFQSWLGDASGIIAVVLILVAFFAVGATMARNYHKVAPNQVAVITGRKRKVDGSDSKVGYRVVRGGGFFLWPIFERVDYLYLNVMMIPVAVKAVPDHNGVLVDVHGIANVKVLSEEAALALAVERFLGNEPEEIQAVAKENLEANLRSIVGTMTIEQMNQDRASMQSKVMGEAVQDMARLGLGVDLLNIQSLSDQQGYMTSLGKKRTAEVQRDAVIGEANAKRDANIESAKALQAGETAMAHAAQEVSNAQRERDMIKAQNSAKVQAEESRVPLIAAQAAAFEQAKVNTAQVEARKAQIEAEINLQQREHARREAELQATTIVQAEKEREAQLISADAAQQAAVITAQGRQKATVIDAEAKARAAVVSAEAGAKAAEQDGEGKRILAAKMGEGERLALEARSMGRIAAARAFQAEQEAEAAGKKANALATAEGELAGRKAEAEGTRLQLLAEAEGALKKAEAFKALDEGGRFLMILQASPMAIAAIGEALQGVMTPVAASIGQGLGNIKEVRVVDLGGAKDGENVLSNMANLPVETINGLVEKAMAAGLGPMLLAAAKRAGFQMPESKS